MADSVDHQISGEWVQGGLLAGRVSKEIRVKLNGDTVFTDQDGLFVIGLARDAAAEATLTFFEHGDEVGKVTYQVRQREYDIQRVTGIPQTIMQPSEEDLERIGREANQVAEARKSFLLDQHFFDDFVAPAEGIITGVYGSQRYYNGDPGNPHYGIDYAGPVGAPVTTPAEGVVILAEPDLFYSGGTIIIDHGYGVSSTLMHLSSVDVMIGQRVVPGDLVGKIGATGRVTGPHLDWRMNWRTVRIDPQMLLDNTLPNPLNN